MPSKLFHILDRFSRFITLLLVLFVAGCGGEGGSKEPSTPDGSDPKFSMPLPKGLWAPASDSDLVMTARAVIDPGKSGERTVDLAVDLTGGRVTGEITEVPAGSHVVEIQYFINQVQVATVTLDVDVAPGQNNPLNVAPSAIRYVEAVSDVLFVADAADPSIKIFDHYSNLKGGVIQPAPTRTLQGERTGIGGPSSGSLFVDSIGGGLYFADTDAKAVRIWNAATVNGDIPPDRVLEGQITQLLQPTGIAFDPFRNRLYVVNRTGQILIWHDAVSISGEVSPAAIIAGPSTGLTTVDHPIYLDVKADTLYVANGNNILVFEKLSALTGPQEVAPARIIEITGGLSQAGVAGDPIRDLLFVSSRDPNGKIYQLAGASAASTVPPTATLAGSETGLNQASSVALAGDVLMALNQGGSQVQVWHHAEQKKDDASPTQIIEMSPALPTALFYVATQNGARDQALETLQVEKPGNGHGTITSDRPGINCGMTCSAPFPVGESITLIAVADVGSTFTGWGGVCSGTNSCVVTMDGAKSVAAMFTDTQVPTTPTNLRATATGASGISLSWTASTDNIGIAVYSVERCQGTNCSNFSEIATSVGVTYNDTGLAPVTSYRYRVRAMDVAANVSGYSPIASATTAAHPALRVTASPSGRGTVSSSPVGISNCGSDCSASFPSGTSVTLTATAASGFTAVFSGGCVSTTTTCTLTITADTNVTVTFNDTQAPTAPTNLTATADSTTQINLSWTASTDNVGVASYVVQRCQGANNCTSFSPIATLTETSYSNSELTAGTIYRYRVLARDAAGNISNPSNIARIPTISNVTSNSITGTGATITWATNIASDSQVEYGSTTSYGSSTTLNPTRVTNHSVVLSGLSSQTLYHYRVKSRDAAGNLAVSADFTFTTSDVTAPTISNVASANINGNGATITWTTNEASDSQVEYGTTAAYGSSTILDTAPVTSHSITLSGLSSQTTYHYRVKSKDAAGNLATSGDFTFTTADIIPPAISSVTTTDITSSGATVEWTTDESSDSQVEYGTTTSYGNSTPLSAARVTGHSVSLSGLTPSSVYHYRVKSKDASGNLAVSSDFTFTTAAPPDTTAPTISDVAASNITGTGATITWTTNENSDSQVEYGTTTSYGSNTTLNTAMVNNHSVTLSGLSDSTVYHYRVKSRDASGNLATSPDFTFTTADTTAPTAPSNLSATAANDNQINLSWTASTDNTSLNGYWIERCQGTGCSNFAPVNTSLVTDTTYNDTGLTAGTSYTYRVQAEDVAGNRSGYSNTESAITAVQLNVTKSGTGTGTVTSTPAGILCGDTCSATFELNTRVTLSAKPDVISLPPSQFAGWGGDCESAGTNETCELDMNSNKSVTAQFDPVISP